MDECDTASMVFRCGQENAPELVADIINQVELNSSAVSWNVAFWNTELKIDFTGIGPIERWQSQMLHWLLLHDWRTFATF